ncbi:MAG TPA: asparagine synthase (glutamine-hydrolyzing) [Candidatus Acidoferrales bacterium]|nr:asparagine synthase (glutamine-hydrolyzing) [Candidatus Acidoferrales bacterium]
MCGICGFYSPNRDMNAAHLDEATRSLTHRGPDGFGLWNHPDGMAGFGHTRLAIIDLETGQQPMHSPDGRFVIIFNGEIYNFRDLRAELEGLGHSFRTCSDTEVLLNAFRQWGADCLVRFNGMFAFAILDIEKRKLFLARDRTGIKPLYYYHGPKGFIFGSELKSLLAWPEVPRRIDVQALTDFLMLGYPLAPATCFRDCRELEPGCYMEVVGDHVSSTRYWRWHRSEDHSNGHDPLGALEQELRAAVWEHLISDVPVGAFLSGGIDSSLLVAICASGGGSKLHTFNVKFGEAGYDESDYARTVAAHVGTKHHEIVLETSKGDVETVSQVLDQFDQPFGDSSAIPTYLICREIRKYVKVVIGGDGGDEMFGGYPRFMHADVIRMMRRIPRWSLGAIEMALHAEIGPGKDVRRRGLRLVGAAKEAGESGLVTLCSILRAKDLAAVIQPHISMQVGDYTPRFQFSGVHDNPGGSELIDATVNSALAADYLRKVDMMSSSHGLEVRVPFLSNRILELAQKLPNRLKYSLRTNKVLLRKLARKYLPQQIADKRKQGFGIPFDTWIGKDGRKEISAILQRASSPIRDIVRPEYLRCLATQFASQEWDRSEISRYSLYQRTYALWSLDRWLDRWRPAL